MTTIQTASSLGGLSIAKRSIIQTRGGLAYADAYQLKTDWMDVVEVWHENQETISYLANLTALTVSRFHRSYDWAAVKVGKFDLVTYPFKSSVAVEERHVQYNLLPMLGDLSAQVGLTMGQFMRRYVFNSYSSGNAIECLDAVGTQYLYDTTHGDGSQDNLLGNAFTEANLETAINTMISLKDHTGKNQIGTFPNYIMVNPVNTIAVNKLLTGGAIVVTGLASTSAASTRTATTLFSGLQPIWSVDINANEFILLSVDGTTKRPFIFNIPDKGDGAYVSSKIVVAKHRQETDDWRISLKVEIGRIATEMWYRTLSSGSAHGTAFNPATDVKDL